MENTNNNSRITPANYIALLALALLALFTFFGWMYGSENGEAGLAIIMTIFEVVVLGALLVLAIKAKSATSHFGMWRIVEWGSIALYVVVAILFASPLLKYFYVMSEKDSLKNTAINEIAAVDSLYSNYQHAMETATKQAVEQITNYVNSRSSSYTMETYIDSMAITRSDVASWGNQVRETWQLKPDSTLSQMRRQVMSWGFFDMGIAQVGKRIESKSEETIERLNKKVKSNIEARVVPIIRYNGSQYVTDSFIEPTFEVPSTGAFHKALRDGNGTTVFGWVMFILLHLLILLNYLVTQGRTIVGPNRKSNYNTNGIDL